MGDCSTYSPNTITVDREDGAFKGVAANTMICLPGGATVTTDEPNVIVGSTCAEFALFENKECTVPKDFTAEKVTNSRTLDAGEDAYTICLPYSLTSGEDVKFYELSKVDGATLTFNEVTTTEALKPYLVVAGSSSATLSTTTSTSIKMGAGQNTEKDGYEMKGTLTGMTNAEAASANAYILQASNEWGKVDIDHTGATIPPYRAYIVATSAASSRLTSIIGDGNDATGINAIRTIDSNGKETYYDLQGHRLNGKPAKQGIYIINGKKVLNK